MNGKHNSVRLVLSEASAKLQSTSHYVRHDAELLLRHVLECDRAWLLAHPEAELTQLQLGFYRELLERRTRYEPVQYILGEQEFFGLPLRVTPAVLIPRPETEHLVEAILERMPRNRPVRIADVGTGSGAIALALASKLPLAEIDALDLSREALAVAEDNAQTLGLAGQLRFLESDLLAAVQNERYDCIVSNPPYISSLEILEPQVALWEPHGALFAGPDGLDAYRALLPQAASRLVPGSFLAIEFGAGQQEALASLFALDPCWGTPEISPDLQGIARVACSMLLKSIR